MSNAPSGSPGGGEGSRELAASLAELRAALLALEQRFEPRQASLPPESRRSAVNLVHYLGLRSWDLRPLQEALESRGLSSLGRSESHVLASLDAVSSLLSPGGDSRIPIPAEQPISRAEGRALLEGRANALFGPPRPGRRVRIMVTAPDEAADSYTLVRDLLASGMDCLRINCAHGDTAVWEKTVANLRRAERELGAPCKVLMDLPGPRARTGALEPGPRVVRVRPRRDSLGRVVAPASVWLTDEESPASPPGPADAVIPLPADFLSRTTPGDRLEFHDARAARRCLDVRAAAEGGRWATIADTAYISTGTALRRASAGSDGARESCLVGPLPPVEERIPLSVGDRLVLTRSQDPGRGPADSNHDGSRLARIPCTPPEVVDDVLTGQAVWFDDGKIGGVVESVGEEGATVLITSTKAAVARLGSAKGINLPDSKLDFPSITPRDLEILPFIAANADLVGYSFVRTPADVEALVAELDRLGTDRPGVILKIEAAEAFRNLPDILLAGLAHPPVGVMIARGDLAVECGFARLAEVQEEILWLSEAAHIPVIWATQVLENLARTGRPSRAEVTDAAVAERAECVMLNKGPFIVDAVRALGSILERMEAHQEKKHSLLRELRVADEFLARLESPGPRTTEAASSSTAPAGPRSIRADRGTAPRLVGPPGTWDVHAAPRSAGGSDD